jgi:hypothetical protein
MSAAKLGAPAFVGASRLTKPFVRQVPGVGGEAGYPFATDLDIGQGPPELICDPEVEMDAGGEEGEIGEEEDGVFHG